MDMIAERSHEHAGSLVESEQHQRHIEHAHERVIADEQERTIGRYVFDTIEYRRGKESPRFEQHAGNGEFFGGRPVADQGLGHAQLGSLHFHRR